MEGTSEIFQISELLEPRKKYLADILEYKLIFIIKFKAAWKNLILIILEFLIRANF